MSGTRTRAALRDAALLAALVPAAISADDPGVYRPKLKPPESVQPFLKQVEPGNDSFPEERTASELQLRLAELGLRLKRSPTAASGIADWLLGPAFRGAALRPLDERAQGSDPALEIQRASRSAAELTLDARAFARELSTLVAEFRAVSVAEFLITSIESDPIQGLATTEVRYDLVGPGRQAWRVEAVGSWRIRWRRERDAWHATEWRASEQLRSRAPAPVFAEVTRAALGGNESFRRQLSADFDSWVATIDSVLARDSNGHHGVSVGDADGDGRDDLYVAQPGGLPNRLYRAKGDGTFEDVTDQAGLGVLDDTAASLFADVDNDGDEDLVLVTATQPLLFLNDGHGRFTRVPDAFRFERPLAGSLMSMAIADYDRDGFLDLYLCVYSYSYGAGEDKLGTPMPYHDARAGRRRCCSGTTATATSSRRRARRGSTPETTATTSPPRGGTTTATAGPTCWWRTTSGPRTSTTTSEGATARSTFEDVAAARRECSTTAPA